MPRPMPRLPPVTRHTRPANMSEKRSGFLGEEARESYEDEFECTSANITLINDVITCTRDTAVHFVTTRVVRSWSFTMFGVVIMVAVNVYVQHCVNRCVCAVYRDCLPT